jgi:hypothetical protein
MIALSVEEPRHAHARGGAMQPVRDITLVAAVVGASVMLLEAGIWLRARYARRSEIPMLEDERPSQSVAGSAD